MSEWVRGNESERKRSACAHTQSETGIGREREIGGEKVLRRVAVCCNVLQCVATCCSVSTHLVVVILGG